MDLWNLQNVLDDIIDVDHLICMWLHVITLSVWRSNKHSAKEQCSLLQRHPVRKCDEWNYWIARAEKRSSSWWLSCKWRVCHLRTALSRRRDYGMSTCTRWHNQEFLSKGSKLYRVLYTTTQAENYINRLLEGWARYPLFQSYLIGLWIAD